jgi:hypothetical protein
MAWVVPTLEWSVWWHRSLNSLFVMATALAWASNVSLNGVIDYKTRHLHPAVVQVFLEVWQLGNPHMATISVGEES